MGAQWLLDADLLIEGCSQPVGYHTVVMKRWKIITTLSCYPCSAAVVCGICASCADHSISFLLITYLSVARMDPKTPRLREKHPVRFEELPDLPADHCHRLLAKYMPKEVTMNKTYQKLFIG